LAAIIFPAVFAGVPMYRGQCVIGAGDAVFGARTSKDRRDSRREVTEDGMREKPQRVVRGEKDDQKKDGEEKIGGHSGG
jgi:hypothetical protein